MPSTTRYVDTRERLNRNEEKVRQLTDRWAGKWEEVAHLLEVRIQPIFAAWMTLILKIL